MTISPDTAAPIEEYKQRKKRAYEALEAFLAELGDISGVPLGTDKAMCVSVSSKESSVVVTYIDGESANTGWVKKTIEIPI